MMERLTTSYNASRGLCAAFNGETDCDLKPGHIEQGIPHRLRSPYDGRWQAYDDAGHVVAQGGGIRRDVGADWATQTWDEYLASLLGFTSVAEQNLAAFKHEAETPMRGHDQDGACCRAAQVSAGSLAEAIATVEDSRRTHVEWRDWWLELQKHGHTEECCEESRQAARLAGGLAHQQECVAAYDNVLAVLRSAAGVTLAAESGAGR